MAGKYQFFSPKRLELMNCKKQIEASLDNHSFKDFKTAMNILRKMAKIDDDAMRLLVQVHNQLTQGAISRILPPDAICASDLSVSEINFKRYISAMKQGDRESALNSLN